MNNKPILVVPKGSLYTGVKALFNECNIDMPDENTRKYYFPDWSDDCALFIAKPKTIPELIASKFCEFGICGYDMVNNSEYENELELISHTGLNKVQICLASKMTLDELTSLKHPIICATEFETIAKHYFTNKIHCPYYVLNTSGSTEGYIDIGADCIIDVVETGATLKANDIKILSNIINTDTCIFEHASLMDCWLPTNIQKVYNLCKQKNN